jgi:hypothetical protein
MGEEEDEEEDPEEVGRRIAARWTSDPDAAGTFHMWAVRCMCVN